MFTAAVGAVVLLLAIFFAWKLFKAAVRTALMVVVLLFAVLFFSTTGRPLVDAVVGAVTPEVKARIPAGSQGSGGIELKMRVPPAEKEGSAVSVGSAGGP